MASTSSTDIRAVFFDLDGTILESLPAHVRAWTSILNEIGITLPELYIELHEGEKAEETVARLAHDHQLDLSHDELMALIDRKRARYRGQAPKGLIPEGRKLIEELLRRGIECDIVTGSVRSNLNGVVPPEEIALFRHIVAADDYQKGKPDPDPFLTAIKLCGFAPEQCLVLENAPLGIASARAAGLKTLAITTTLPAKYLAEADAVISKHDQLLEHL